jgi:secreted Zn-dependent insulinase-like peptidase
MAQVAKDAWFEIEERRYTFNHGAMQAALVSSVTKQELSDFAFKLLCSERKLLVATSSVEDRLEDSMSDEVKAAFHFVSKPEEIHSMPLYESNV